MPTEETLSESLPEGHFMPQYLESTTQQPISDQTDAILERPYKILMPFNRKSECTDWCR